MDWKPENVAHLLRGVLQFLNNTTVTLEGLCGSCKFFAIKTQYWDNPSLMEFMDEMATSSGRSFYGMAQKCREIICEAKWNHFDFTHDENKKLEKLKEVYTTGFRTSNSHCECKKNGEMKTESCLTEVFQRLLRSSGLVQSDVNIFDSDTLCLQAEDLKSFAVLCVSTLCVNKQFPLSKNSKKHVQDFFDHSGDDIFWYMKAAEQLIHLAGRKLQTLDRPRVFEEMHKLLNILSCTENRLEKVFSLVLKCQQAAKITTVMQKEGGQTPKEFLESLFTYINHDEVYSIDLAFGLKFISEEANDLYDKITTTFLEHPFWKETLENRGFVTRSFEYTSGSVVSTSQFVAIFANTSIPVKNLRSPLANRYLNDLDEKLKSFPIIHQMIVLLTVQRLENETTRETKFVEIGNSKFWIVISTGTTTNIDIKEFATILSHCYSSKEHLDSTFEKRLKKYLVTNPTSQKCLKLILNVQKDESFKLSTPRSDTVEVGNIGLLHEYYFILRDYCFNKKTTYELLIESFKKHSCQHILSDDKVNEILGYFKECVNEPVKELVKRLWYHGP